MYRIQNSAWQVNSESCYYYYIFIIATPMRYKYHRAIYMGGKLRLSECLRVQGYTDQLAFLALQHIKFVYLNCILPWFPKQRNWKFRQGGFSGSCLVRGQIDPLVLEFGTKYIHPSGKHWPWQTETECTSRTRT